jgi:hypothetical protein
MIHSASNIRELANARAAAYADRYTAYFDTSVTNHPRQFNFKRFKSNVVLRWEYKPGSVFYAVWAEGRQEFAGAQGTRSLGGDMSDLFHTHPLNTFLIKVSDWFDW